jgi:hypothetical protein
VQSSGVRLDSISIVDNPNGRERELQRKFQESVAKIGGTGILISDKRLLKDLSQMLPRLARIHIALAEQPEKESYLEVRGPTPKDLEIYYRVNLGPCAPENDAAGLPH